MNTAPKLKVDEALCTGCAACELACSFHLAREFRPAASAITVYRDDRSGTVSLLVGEKCDLCRGESSGPLCVRFCAPGALVLDTGSG